MSTSTERTRLIERETAQTSGNESYELADQRQPGPGEIPSQNDRSADEIGIDASLEPALGRKTWKGYLILILTPVVLCPLPIVVPTMVSVFQMLRICFLISAE